MLREDFPKIPHAVRPQIERAIRERLTVAPLLLGKALKHSLSGMRSLRVGDYRIGYVVEGANVIIKRIEHRRDAYKGW